MKSPFAKRRDDMERELLEALETAQTAYQEAKPHEREAAKSRFLDALRAFSQFTKT